MADQPQGTPLIPNRTPTKSTIGEYTESPSIKADRDHKDNELWHATAQSVLEYYKGQPDASDDKIIATLDRLWTWMTT